MPYTLITGASMGIGETFALEFARRGHNLVLVARSEEKMQLLASELRAKHGTDVRVFRADLNDADAPSRIFIYCRDQRLDIDLLVNCAGLSRAGEFRQLPPDKLDEIMTVNMMAAARLCRLFLPAMILARSGGIINVASLGGLQGVPGLALYSATKSFLITLSEALHIEAGKSRVKVLAVCPGFIDTGFLDRTGHDASGIRLPIYGADKVVQAAIRGFENKRIRVFPTLLDAVLSFSQRFASRKFAVRLSGYFAGIIRV
ncbi:MAG: SDR family oxidoreductase [Chlorobiaceae bacterium]|nr:SDR family oxidoreductase [Chlorobiaceae bacterium]